MMRMTIMILTVTMKNTHTHPHPHPDLAPPSSVHTAEGQKPTYRGSPEWPCLFWVECQRRCLLVCLSRGKRSSVRGRPAQGLVMGCPGRVLTVPLVPVPYYGSYITLALSVFPRAHGTTFPRGGIKTPLLPIFALFRLFLLL